MMKFIVLCVVLSRGIFETHCATEQISTFKIIHYIDASRTKADSSGSKIEVSKPNNDVIISRVTKKLKKNNDLPLHATTTERVMLTFPYSLSTMDKESNNKASELINYLNKINVKYIVPLIGSGSKRQDYPTLGNRRRKKQKQSRKKMKHAKMTTPYRRSGFEDNENQLVFLLQPDLKLLDEGIERRFLSRNREVNDRSTRTIASRRQRDRASKNYERGGRRSLNYLRNAGPVVRDFMINNPEVLEGYIRRRSKVRRMERMPEDSSGSSSEDDDDDSVDEKSALRSTPDDSASSNTKADARRSQKVDVNVLEQDGRRHHKKKKDNKSKNKKNQIRRRRRRKKPLSTSSSGNTEDDDDDDDDEFRRIMSSFVARKGSYKNVYTNERRSYNGAEQYDDKAEDYAITTRAGVWDYEHEEWAPTPSKTSWNPDFGPKANRTERYDSNRDYVRKKDLDEEQRMPFKHFDDEHIPYPKDKREYGEEKKTNVGNALTAKVLNTERDQNDEGIHFLREEVAWAPEGTTDYNLNKKRYFNSDENNQGINKENRFKKVDYAGESIYKNENWVRDDVLSSNNNFAGEKYQNNDKPYRNDDGYDKKYTYKSDVGDIVRRETSKTGKIVDDWLKNRDKGYRYEYRDNNEYTKRKPGLMYEYKNERDNNFKKDYMSRERMHEREREINDWGNTMLEYNKNKSVPLH